MLFTIIVWDTASTLPRKIKPAAPPHRQCDVWTIFLSAAALHLPVTC